MPADPLSPQARNTHNGTYVQSSSRPVKHLCSLSQGAGASAQEECKSHYTEHAKYKNIAEAKEKHGAETVDAYIKRHRYNEVMPQPENAKYKLCVVEFNVPGAKNGGTDKGPNGHRIDSIPIANGVIKAGGSCELIKYYHDKHDDFAAQVQKYDALIVRINPGQLSQGTTEGTQKRFDDLMNSLIAKGKAVWSSPKVQTNMGAKDALCKIANLKCGLIDTFAYYDKETLEKHFKQTMAFQPRVIKQNRGSAGEGIWLCWLEGKEYCKKFGDASLDDGDKLKLMEMNDNHVEYHTVKEFLTFCVEGPDHPDAGEPSFQELGLTTSWRRKMAVYLPGPVPQGWQGSWRPACRSALTTAYI